MLQLGLGSYHSTVIAIILNAASEYSTNPDAHHAPPPPYSASHAYQANNNGFFGGANGFWTGAAVGGTLASLFGGRQGGGW
eukprot:437502-Hanusia_phi.AAC.1